MAHTVEAVIGIIVFAFGGILALMGFAGFLHGLMTSVPAEMYGMQIFLIVGPALIPIGMYLIIHAAVAKSA